MRHSQRRDFSKGDRLSIFQSEMKKLGQDTIPPLVPSVSTEPRIASQRSAAQKIHTDTVITIPESDRKKPLGKKPVPEEALQKEAFSERKEHVGTKLPRKKPFMKKPFRQSFFQKEAS